jgi:ligand-binding sensor domain-containing protein/two-component sensor histidine kinase
MRKAGMLWPVLLLAVAQSAWAQQYGFTAFGPRDGLAQSQVRCMAQDSAGYLWFGTLGGASRFDGESFTNYGLRQGLRDPQVNAMLALPDGSVWLACGTTLTRFDGEAMWPVPLPGNTGEARILALAAGRDGTVYVGLDGAGLLQVRNGHAEVPVGWPADTAQGVRSLLMLPDGNLMVGLRNGLLRWTDGVAEQVPLPYPAAISALALDQQGVLWVGTFGSGLVGLKPGGGHVLWDESKGLLQNNIRSLLTDRSGRLWIGTKFGVSILENGRMRSYTHYQGMPNDNVWCTLEDNEGGLWIGTDGGGVLRYAGERFVTFTVTEGLCSDLVMAVVGDRQGDLWLGTYNNGICRMDAMANITTLDGLPNNTVWCGLADPDGSLWFGTSDGLCHIDRGRVVPLDPAKAMAGQRVLSLHRAADGTLWCGMRDGLSVIHADGSVERIVQMDGIVLRGVRAMQEDAKGGMWMATDVGIVRYHRGKATRYTTVEGLPHNTVFCLATDGKGRLWAGTSNGLACFIGGGFRSMELGLDFGSNYVGLLLPAKGGAMWAGTNNGLFRFRPDSLLDDPGQLRHFTEVDGLRGLECDLNAALEGRDGRLFFGTTAGLTRFDPAAPELRRADKPPRTYITGVSSFLQPIPGVDSLGIGSGPRSPIDVAYRKNHLTFAYTAIALSDGRQVRFQYRLEGFDGEWLPITDARAASYSNLPQGDYAFEVRAADRSGHWGQAARLAFRIAPPWWLTWWFFLLCGAALAGILYGIWRFRALRRERVERTRQLVLRSRMLKLEQQALNANMNRHFIFNALNSIQYAINRQDRAVANKYLTSFAKLIRKNLDASANDTTTLAEEIARLELYLLLEHMRFKDKFTYAITVSPAVDARAVNIPAMMLQPYVENSIWHGILPMAHPGRVEVAVELHGTTHVRIRIHDDGIGIDRSMDGKNGETTGHISRGIEITKGRADILRRMDLVDIRIQGPEPLGGAHGRGTQVVIDLPVTVVLKPGG